MFHVHHATVYQFNPELQRLLQNKPPQNYTHVVKTVLPTRELASPDFDSISVL